MERLLADVHARVMRLLERRGLLETDAEDAVAADAPALAACYEGAVTQRVALGPARGSPVFRSRASLRDHLAGASARVERAGLLCAPLDGFDLHGRVAFGAAQRGRIEQLVRYCARPLLADGRLETLSDGD